MRLLDERNQRNFDDLEKHYLYDLPEDKYEINEIECDQCGGLIDDVYYEIDGERISEDCLDDLYKRHLGDE